MDQTEKIFLESPTPIDGFNTDSAGPRSTTSGEASLVWVDENIIKSGNGKSGIPHCGARHPRIACMLEHVATIFKSKCLK